MQKEVLDNFNSINKCSEYGVTIHGHLGLLEILPVDQAYT